MIRYVLNTLGSFRSALAVGVGLPFLVAVSAFAQTPEATTERVIVTGSYIPTAETESALPVTVYTAEVMQKQGANTPAEALRQLPSFVGNAQTETNSNGGDGTALINLRAIGTVNVLTLVNGRRTFNFRDINLIPIGGVSRTEVLKDGASSIYGSDAVAGVVNFIMLDGPTEKPYEGAELFGRYDNTTETDAHVRQVYLRGGVTGLDGKVSIAAVGEYYSRANLYSVDRAQVARTGDLSNNPGDPNYPSSSGMQWGGTNNNSQTFAGRVAVNASASTRFPVTGQLVLINPTNGAVTPGAYRPFVLNADASEFNFRLFTPAIPSMEKAMYMVTGRYKIFGDGMQLYGDLMYSKADQDNGLAGAPFAMNNVFNGLAEVQASHFNPFGTEVNTLRYRLQQELGLRRNFFHKDAWRYVAGLNGDFNIKDNAFISRFGYDTGFVYERFDEITTTAGDARRSYLRALIAPVGFTNATAPLPITATGTFNPFIGQFAPLVGSAPTYVNGVPTGLTEHYDNTTAAPDYTQGGASYVGTSNFYERDYLYDAKINAHLFPGLWNGGVDIAGGYEHRNTEQQNIPDPVPLTNDTLGFTAGSALKTRQEVDSFFAELNVPLVTSTMNVPFVKSLDVSFAWRYEKFTDTDLYATSAARRQGSFTNTNTNEDFGGSPRIALRYQPIADLTLRATWGQSFRSPSPGDLFSPVFQDFPVVFDPVQHVTVQPTDGVYEGGNPNILPETTDSYSAGLVWTPKFIPGFTMTLDIYQVFTSNLIIDPASFAQILLSTGVTDPDGCGLGGGGPAAPGGTGVGVTRFPDGSLDCIDASEGNAGKRLVEGLDVTAVYELPTERFGKFTFSGGYNHFFIWKAEPGIGGTHNFLGDYSKAFPLTPGAIPFNKAFARLEWQWKGFDFVATGNYIGDYNDDPAFIAGNFIVGGTDNEPVWAFHRTDTSYITLDMQLSYEWVKPATEAPPTYAKDSKDSKHVMTTEAATPSIWQRMLWGTRLTVGVNNAFDRYPPSELGAFNDNYDTNLYSIRNRSWYVSFNKKF